MERAISTHLFPLYITVNASSDVAEKFDAPANTNGSLVSLSTELCVNVSDAANTSVTLSPFFLPTLDIKLMVVVPETNIDSELVTEISKVLADAMS